MRFKKLAVLLLCSFLSFSALGEERPRLVVSINPLASILREIVKADAELDTLVSARVDPHMFELRPAALKTLAHSDIFFTVGLGLEFWAKELPLELRNKTVDFAKELGLKDGNPHIWLVPDTARNIAQIMKKHLCVQRPQQCAEYAINLTRFEEGVMKLDREIKETISHWQQRAFISYHPAWELFAQQYGLQDAGSFKQGHSSEISIVDLKRLIDLAHKKQVSVFFMEPGIDISQVQNFLKESELRLVTVDDLGTPGEGYCDLMRRNVAAMDQGMRN